MCPAFPDQENPVSLAPKLCDRLCIPDAIFAKLARPELRVGLRDRCLVTIRMVMPKAAVHEDCPTRLSICKVGTARERLHVLSIMQAQQSKADTHFHFGRSAGLPNAGHAFRNG